MALGRRTTKDPARPAGTGSRALTAAGKSRGPAGKGAPGKGGAAGKGKGAPGKGDAAAKGKGGPGKGGPGKGGPGKGGPGKAAKAPGPNRREKLGQLKTAFSMTRQRDPKMLPLVVGVFLLTFLVFLGIGFAISHPIYVGFLGLLFALVATAVVFGKRVQRTAYAQVEGQLGAAAAVLTNMRGDWRVTPAVGFTKEQDLVHRVIGRPGLVLVGEGAPNRTRNLIGAEKRKISRIVGETPLYDVTVGEAEGQVPLRDLERHFLKLPRNIKPAQVNDLDRRLKAFGGAVPPVPKGPMPNRVPRAR